MKIDIDILSKVSMNLLFFQPFRRHMATRMYHPANNVKIEVKSEHISWTVAFIAVWSIDINQINFILKEIARAGARANDNTSYPQKKITIRQGILLETLQEKLIYIAEIF